MSNLGLKIYIVFIISWFLHLPARVPLLGAIRADLLLVLVMCVFALSKKLAGGDAGINTHVGKLLITLIVYSILTIPFVEWPGSVIKIGLPNLVKAVVFYYFTVAFIRTEQDLKKFVFVFLICQVLRILEPFYLNITQGYWGSQASMLGGNEFLSRLSGGPYDIVNPNGLAFIICTVLVFLYFRQGLSWKNRAAFLILSPISLYTLMLTGSRSGVVGLFTIFLIILMKSKRPVLLLTTCIVAGVIGFSNLASDLQDRYLSIFGKGDKNIETASERFSGMAGQLDVALRRPIFGHGLGTSAEANYHYNFTGPYAGKALKAHNLYLELIQEIGLIGAIIFTLFLIAVFSEFRATLRDKYILFEDELYISKFVDAMRAWIFLNFVFSFASYGLSSYDWYLFAGFTAVIQRFSKRAPNPDMGATRLVATYLRR